MLQPPETLEANEKGPHKNNWLGDVIFAIGQDMKQVSPGELATLRRTAGAPMRNARFWHWKNRHGWPDSQDDDWAYIITFMAIITRKGRDEQKPSPHNAKNRLGKALCDGGEAIAPSRPQVSEERLARLLNARGAKRREAVLRAARMLARNATPVNCADLAWFLLNGKDDKPAQEIAKAYYGRLHQAPKQNDDKSGDNKK